MSIEQFIERNGQLEGMLVDLNTKIKNNRKQMIEEIKHCIREFGITHREITEIYENLNLPIYRSNPKWEMGED